MQTNINVGQGARRTGHARFSPRPLRERVAGGRVRGITEQGNNFIYPLIGFECLRTQNHFPRRGGSQTTGGFTLIELLVVVLIIGILAAVALPQYQKAVDKARFVQTKVTMQEVFRAQQVYFLANGNYATTWDELGADLPPVTSGGGISNYAYWDWGYCYLYAAYGGCVLYFKSGDVARLVRYWDGGTPHCSSEGNGRGKRLCSSFQP